MTSFRASLIVWGFLPLALLVNLVRVQAELDEASDEAREPYLLICDPLEYWEPELYRLQAEWGRYDQMRAETEGLEGLVLAKAIYRAGMRDVTISRLLPMYRDLRLACGEMEANGLGPRHSRRMTVEAQLAELEPYLIKASETWRSGVEVQRALLEARIKSAIDEVVSLKQQNLEAFRVNREAYREAIVDLDRARGVVNQEELAGMEAEVEKLGAALELSL